MSLAVFGVSVLTALSITGCARSSVRLQASSPRSPGTTTATTQAVLGPSDAFCAADLTGAGIILAPVSDGTVPTRTPPEVIAEAESRVALKPWFAARADAYFAAVRSPPGAPKPGPSLAVQPADRWVVEVTVEEGSDPPGSLSPSTTMTVHDLVLVDDASQTQPPWVIPCRTSSPSPTGSDPGWSATAWSGPRRQALATFGPDATVLGIDVGGGCAIVTDAGADVASSCGASPPRPGGNQWTPVLEARLPGGGWVDAASVGTGALTFYGTTPDGHQVRGAVGTAGWALVASATGPLVPQAYGLGGRPLQSSKPGSARTPTTAGTSPT